MDQPPVNIPPTPNLPPVPQAPIKEEMVSKKELKMMEKLMEINLGLSLVFGGVLLFVIIALVSWKFNLADYFKKKPASQTQVTPKAQSLPFSPGAVLAAPKMFINDTVVDTKKAFIPPATKVKLTLHGQLKKEVFGYLPYWLLDKVDQIDTRLFTTVSYFGLEVDGQGEIIKSGADSKILDPWVKWQSDKSLDKFIQKSKRNRTKVLVTLKCFNADNIARLVTSEKASQKFIENALYLVNSRALDGVNVDFEYVGTPDKSVRDGFSLLISNLNKELKRQYPKSILTVATFVDAASAFRIHDTEILAKNSDGLVIMAYDFHTPGSSLAGPVAPMEGYGNSLVGLLNSYLEKVSPEKIILGVGYYGYDWPSAGKDKNSAVAAGEVKVYPFGEIAESTKKTKLNWDEEAQTPWYTYLDPESGQNRIVHFENARSLGIKYDFVNQKNLQGVGIWALGFDGLNTELVQLLADKFSNQP